MIQYDSYGSGMVQYWYSSRLETFTFHSNIRTYVLALEYTNKVGITYVDVDTFSSTVHSSTFICT